jgi:hypothetical protein
VATRVDHSWVLKQSERGCGHDDPTQQLRPVASSEHGWCSVVTSQVSIVNELLIVKETSHSPFIFRNQYSWSNAHSIEIIVIVDALALDLYPCVLTPSVKAKFTLHCGHCSSTCGDIEQVKTLPS